MEESKNIQHTPKNLDGFKGQFIVFFSNDPDSEVLFSSFNSQEAQDFAEKIFIDKKERPTILRISNSDNDTSRLFFLTRF